MILIFLETAISCVKINSSMQLWIFASSLLRNFRFFFTKNLYLTLTTFGSDVLMFSIKFIFDRKIDEFSKKHAANHDLTLTRSP